MIVDAFSSPAVPPPLRPPAPAITREMLPQGTTTSTPATDGGATTTSRVVARTTTTAATTAVAPTDSFPLPSRPPSLRPDGLGIAYFGQTESETVPLLEAALGQPSEDSGWVDAFSPWGSCPGDLVRRLAWDGLAVFLVENPSGLGPLPAGTPAFASYLYFEDGFDLETPEGIHVGSTLDQLEAAYSSRVDISPAEWLGGGYLYFLVRPMEGWPTWAMMSGYVLDGAVESIEAGILCGD